MCLLFQLCYLLQAAYCICNLASAGSEVCLALFSDNILTGVILLLKVPDSEIVHMALCLTQMILQHVPEVSIAIVRGRQVNGERRIEGNDNENELSE